jgi:hypothetical protein
MQWRNYKKKIQVFLAHLVQKLDMLMSFPPLPNASSSVKTNANLAMARPEKIRALHTMRARISAAAASPSEGLINKFKQMCRGSLFNRGKNEPPA